MSHHILIYCDLCTTNIFHSWKFEVSKMRKYSFVGLPSTRTWFYVNENLHKDKYIKKIKKRVSKNLGKYTLSDMNRCRKINTLVFSSGGINGLYFIGCLKALEEHMIVEGITKLIGTSAGALCATFIALKYSYQDLREAIMHINTASLLNISLNTIISFTKELGIENGEKFLKVISVFFVQKLGRDDITFAELYNWNPVHLIISGTCLDTSSLEYFDHINTPQMKVIDALRISISIPLLFTPVIYEGKCYIDGAVLCPYPISNPTIQRGRDKVLGFRIGYSYTKKSTQSLLSYITTIIQTIHSNLKISTQGHEKEKEKENENENKREKESDDNICIKDDIWTVRICAGQTSLKFVMSDTEKKTALKLGYDRTNDFLKMKKYSIMKKNDILEKCLKRKKVIMGVLHSTL